MPIKKKRRNRPKNFGPIRAANNNQNPIGRILLKRTPTYIKSSTIRNVLENTVLDPQSPSPRAVGID
jgi:hypothetical protein